MKFKIIYLIFLILAAGCSYNLNHNNVIRIVGSDTMLELTSNLAEQFMKENPGISVKVDGGGTATGIRTLINNDIDICMASRNLKPDEAKMLADYYGSLGLVYLIAKDALSIYVNPENPVKNLNIGQLKDVFTGKISNWKNLGGNDALIIPVIRNNNSGTYLYFKEHVLEGDEYSENSVIKPTTKEIIKFVSENINAVGYGGMGYTGNVIHANINGISPTEENVRNDSYPITRYLHFLTTKSPGGSIKKFIDWVLSPAGQSVVGKSGFIPLWENKL
jgi:phosphate transport system substrate-binding protein